MLYKNYDQAALDRQFNNRLHTPEYANYFSRWELLSRQTEKKYLVIKGVSYGNLPLEKSDIYPSSQTQSKTLVFIHGGYWQMLDKSAFHFIADAFHSDNITTVFLNYPLAPQYTMDQMVSSCRKAIGWLYQNIDGYHGDPNQIYVAGHSAGGHLAAMLMATDWPRFNAIIPANIIKGVCALSGLFNLVPIRLSYLNKVLNLEQEMAIRNSPVNLQPVNSCSILIAVGTAETNEFIDQSTELSNSWEERNISVKLLKVPGKNHFSILEAMTDQNADCYFAVRELMKI
jgi:arylformamidase